MGQAFESLRNHKRESRLYRLSLFFLRGKDLYYSYSGSVWQGVFEENLLGLQKNWGHENLNRIVIAAGHDALAAGGLSI